MARNFWALRRLSSRSLRSVPYPIPSHNWKVSKEGGLHKTTVTSEKRDWKKATCSVCMEYPHNAVLLLCSSHDKGCRPYMCGTSYRHSNCLDQFKNACTKTRTSHDDPLADGRILGSNLPDSTACDKSETLELSCPLCRGQVKGWTVVVPAREYLNNKKRSCMQENCSFVGTYRELSKHVRSKHPSARPRVVDPTLEHKWRMLEHEMEQQDVMSTIRSSMPRSVVFGDYVIEMSNTDLNTDDEVGDDGQGNADWDNRGISRSILYFILRQSAQLLRLQGENGLLAAMGEDQGYSSLNRDAADAYEDDVDRIITQERETGIPRSGRQHRRRRRSRGRSISSMH